MVAEGQKDGKTDKRGWFGLISTRWKRGGFRCNAGRRVGLAPFHQPV